MPTSSQATIESMSTVRSQTIINTTLSNSSIEPLPLTTALPVALILASIVILCLFGNVLVILAVFTFRPLRTVQNFFIVSLAFSDMLVAIIVMPFHIVKHIVKRWIFGRFFCQVFVTSDVLLCTASILNLCAIALDRYWAISDPIQYARQRTIRRVLVMIMIVWILSAMISIPPIITTILGSTELKNFDGLQQCELSDNKIYVIYSACGSFYIPALIMTVVYAQVFIETRKRFRERARAAAKLANATRSVKTVSTGQPLKTHRHRHHHHHHHRRQNPLQQRAPPTVLPLSEANSIYQPSLNYSLSNGSAQDYCSIDEVEDGTGSKIESLNMFSSSNSSPQQHPLTSKKSQKYDLEASQISLTYSGDENKTLPMNAEPSAINGDGNFSVISQSSARESKSDHDSLNQQQQHQHVSVQTTDLIKTSTTKDTNRKILFKGKSLASLMHERQKISLTRERRLSRTLGIIISVFLLCWLPFFVTYILSPFVNPADYIQEPLLTMILWLGYINSAVNPLIYTVFNVEFRTAFQRLLFPKSTMRNHINKHHRK